MANMFLHGGFGPNEEDGFGVGYEMHREKILFNLSSYKKGEEMKKAMEDTFRDLGMIIRMSKGSS